MARKYLTSHPLCVCLIPCALPTCVRNPADKTLRTAQIIRLHKGMQPRTVARLTSVAIFRGFVDPKPRILKPKVWTPGRTLP